MRLAPAYTSKLVVVLTFFAAIWNIFVIVNYQDAKQSHKTCSGDISEQDATLLKGERPHSYLKGLQMDIKETFRKFEGKNSTIGKAFRLAALHGKKGKERRNIEKTTTSLPDCQQTPFLLVLIHSAPANLMEREAIRMSWGRPQNSINEANAGKQLTSRLVKDLFGINCIFQITTALSAVHFVVHIELLNSLVSLVQKLGWFAITFF